MNSPAVADPGSMPKYARVAASVRAQIAGGMLCLARPRPAVLSWPARPAIPP